uniref:UBX domain-containing protein n=1 Tax=Araucaria cunninghamii TaxID=56994 RepID=A0A0D6QY36_ARACU
MENNSNNSIDLEKQSMIASFVDVVGESADKARQFLQATNWQLEEAIQLFYVGNESGVGASSANIPLERQSSASAPTISRDNDTLGNEVRPPLPVKREALYDDVSRYRAQRLAQSSNQPNSVDAFRNFEDEAKYRSVWASDQNGSSSVDGPKDNLAALYRPPFGLMYQGTFEQAKIEAARQGKWLIANVQSTKEFNSYTLNRDTWANEAVKETITTSFIFWQIYDDTEEGRKVCTYYHLAKMPTTLVIDPITGQKMRGWNGMIDPERFLEDLIPYMDKGPTERHLSLPPQKRQREVDLRTASSVNENQETDDDELRRALAASLEDINQHMVGGNGSETSSKHAKDDQEATAVPSQKVKREYPSLPEEPQGDKEVICRVGVRFPDGKRVQRRFLRKDPIQLLWSFCCSQIEEAAEGRQFRLAHAVPGASEVLDYNSKLSFGDSGICNSVISMTWE